MARHRRRAIEGRRWTMRQRSMQTWRVQQGVWSATRSWTRARAQSRPVRQTRRRAPQATPHEIVFAASPACSHHPCLESSACEAPVRSSVRSRPMKLQVMCHERVAMRVMQDAAERPRIWRPNRQSSRPAPRFVWRTARNEFSHVEDRAGELDLVVRSTGVSS
jgi:hypothetical protein